MAAPAPSPDRTSPQDLAPRAVFGLGHMGGGMAASLLRAGHPVLGVDPGPVPTPGGVRRVTAAEAIAEAEVLVLSLPGTAQVDELLPDLLAAPGPRLVIDASTCPPGDSRRRAEVLAEAGHLLVDAPVSGGPAGAATGSLTVFLGCPEERLAEVLAALEPLAAQVHHIGTTGAGSTAKLLNNLLCGIHLAAARALHGAAEASEVDLDRLLAALNTASGRSAVTEVNLPRWVLSDSYDSGFPVGLMTRDVGLAADLTADLGVSSPLVEAARSMWDELLRTTDPRDDFNRMVTAR